MSVHMANVYSRVRDFRDTARLQKDCEAEESGQNCAFGVDTDISWGVLQ